MKKTIKGFGATVSALRKKLGMTGQQLVDKVRAAGHEFSNSYLSDIEHGRRIPGEDTARALAVALETDADHLVMLAGAVPARIVKRGFARESARKAVKALEG